MNPRTWNEAREFESRWRPQGVGSPRFQSRYSIPRLINTGWLAVSLRHWGRIPTLAATVLSVSPLVVSCTCCDYGALLASCLFVLYRIDVHTLHTYVRMAIRRNVTCTSFVTRDAPLMSVFAWDGSRALDTDSLSSMWSHRYVSWRLGSRSWYTDNLTANKSGLYFGWFAIDD